MSTETEPRVLPEVTMTPELAAAIKNAVSQADIRGLIIAEAEGQLATKTQLDADQAAAAQAAADKVAADAAVAAEVAKVNQVFSRTEVIGGKEFTFSAASDAEVDRQVLAAYRVALSTQTPADPVVVPDPEAVAKAAEAEVLAKADLERKFRLGEISAADYIQQSGAVNDYLTKQGLSVETLKTVVEKNRADAVVQSWSTAADAFRTSAVGSDWPGGIKNRELLGDKLASLGLLDATDKVAAMAQAWTAMKSTGAYFPNGDEPATPAAAPAADVPDPAAVAAKAAADAAAVETARAVAAAKVRATSSSMFGQSSGTSGAPIVSPAVVAASKVVPADATPQEIMDAWKAEQVKNGQSPDDVFKEMNRGKRI